MFQIIVFLPFWLLYHLVRVLLWLTLWLTVAYLGLLLIWELRYFIFAAFGGICLIAFVVLVVIWQYSDRPSGRIGAQAGDRVRDLSETPRRRVGVRAGNRVPIADDGVDPLSALTRRAAARRATAN